MGARRCPHCHAPQGTQRWRIIGTSLKWVGGVTAALSLFLVANQVNNVVSSWTGRQESVTALIKASSLQAESGDYTGAWGSLDEALDLEPGSIQVQAQRVDLAMLWVQNAATVNDQTFSEIINPLLPSLYLGAVRSTPGERADALAHIGWANALRAIDGGTWLEIDGQFEAALQADPQNVFAHTWQARWLYMRPNTADYDVPRIDLARTHFDAALATGQYRSWIRSMQLFSYLGGYDPVAQAEGIKVVADIKMEGGTISTRHANYFRRSIKDLVLKNDDQADILRAYLLDTFTWPEILDLYVWVMTIQPRGSYDQPQDRYVFATLTEKSGHPDTALTLYRDLLEGASRGYTFSSELVESIARLEGEVDGRTDGD